MAELLLFHHAQGLTSGCLALAEKIRSAGHVVHTPDLYEGKTFSDLADGVAHAREIGFDTVAERGRLAAEGRPEDVVYAGISLGVMPAQSLAQTRPGASGAVLISGCVPPSEFGTEWPPGLPLQLHTKEDDDMGDVEIAREIVGAVGSAELFVYPGDQHLFADSSLASYDAAAARLLTERVLELLGRVDQRG
jgi:dienelactone hydrolase